MTQPDIPTLLRDCTEWAELAAQTVRPFFRARPDVSFKSDESPVTIADQTVEQVLRQAIAERYPNHAFFGEETGITGGTEGRLWVIDPIDGTRSFISGNPLFGTLLAHLDGGEPLAGVIAMPMLSEVYAGGQGHAATLNGTPIRVSGQTDPARATLYINEGEKIHATRPDAFARLLRFGQTRRFAYDCYPHALLAAGHVDVVVDFDLKPYDFLALRPVVEAAGGIVTDWQGNLPKLNYEGPVVSAASKELHRAVLNILAQQES